MMRFGTHSLRRLRLSESRGAEMCDWAPFIWDVADDNE